MEKDLQTKIFEWFAKKSKLVIRLFWLPYILIVIFTFYAGYVIFGQNTHFDLVYSLGKLSGQAALFLLGLIVLPGILGRFRIEIKITRVITLFRRQLGITVFLLANNHYGVMRVFPKMAAGLPPTAPPIYLFETIGMLAFMIFFVMFLTSNNFSVKMLGHWWKVLHRFVYVALWALVAHTALQEVGAWTFYIGFFAMLEVVSWVYYFLNKPAAGTTSGSDGTAGQNQGQSGTNVVNSL